MTSLSARLLVAASIVTLAAGLSVPSVAAAVDTERPSAREAGDDEKPKAGKAKKKSKKSQSTEGTGTATVTVNGITYTATAAKGKCQIGEKAGPVTLPNVRSFEGTDGTVTVDIRIDPDNPRATAFTYADVKGVSGDDPFWQGQMKEFTTAGRTTTASFTFISPIEDAKAVAARQAPPSFPGTVSFTC